MKTSKTFIRSTKCSLKFNNQLKHIQLDLLLKEYNRCLNIYIEFLWNIHVDGARIKARFLKQDQPQIETFLSARALNSCINHASAIIRSKIEQIKYYQNIIQNIEESKNPTKRQSDYRSMLIERIEKMQKPPVSEKLEMRLDSKNTKIVLDPKTKNYDLILELFCMGTPKFNLVSTKHKHFNKLMQNGRLLNGVTITPSHIQFHFEFEKQSNTNQKKIGIDIGINTCLTVSSNERITTNDKGKPYHEIMSEIVRKKKGSKAFGRKLKERDNCTNYCVKQLPWEDLSEICIEDIKNLRKCKRTNKIRRHWNYRFILDALEAHSELHNVYVNRKNPMYTSQRCSSCGYVDDENRNEEVFICLNCGYAANADYNASMNLYQDLYPFKRSEIPGGRKFFWDCSGVRPSGRESEAPFFKKENIFI